MVAGTDGRAHQKTVKLGIRNGDDVQITDGVSENDKVIASGAYGLPDKTKIKIETAEAPAEGGSEESKPGAASKPKAEDSDEK
jgi:multidrug efflux pump subunit AcrA (membrane-fusion protein)